MKKANTQVPVIFQVLNEFDTRFMRVKIWLMHLGQNYNGSYFDKQSVEKALPSLANTPILGYIEDKSGQDDFSDHRMILVRENGDVKVKYIGQAYGVIPQDNNAQFEVRVGDDGIAREYLTCEGLIWQKWDAPTEIMNRDLVKSQSMELDENYDGFWDDSTGLFHFTNFKFFGACILGSGVQPAMNSATVEKMFSVESLQQEIHNKMEEFKVVYSRYQLSLMDDTHKDKEGEDMQEKLLELLAKFSLTEEVLQANEFKLEDYSTEEELEAKLLEISAEVNHSDSEEVEVFEAEAPEVTEEEVVVTEATEPVVNEFEIENASLKTELEKVISEFEAFKADQATLQGKFDALTTEAEELRTFKATKMATERQAEEDALFEQFSTQLTEDELSPVKEKASTMEISAIELELFAMVGKKTTKFSARQPKEKEVVKIGFSKEENKDVSGYNYILEKHLK